MSDKYQKAVKYLERHPDEITEAWFNPNKHVAGCLFQYANKTGLSQDLPDVNGAVCSQGCLTMVRCPTNGCEIKTRWVAETPELTEAIQADTRIPDRRDYINVTNLHVFAEWQARLDKELNRGNNSL